MTVPEPAEGRIPDKPALEGLEAKWGGVWEQDGTYRFDRDSATRAGLRYVSDGAQGISRRRVGTGWAYYAPDGGRIADPAVRKRLNALAIPPAWTDVWICPDPDGHIQATARDARGRKQYRYHPHYREARDRIVET